MKKKGFIKTSILVILVSIVTLVSAIFALNVRAEEKAGEITVDKKATVIADSESGRRTKVELDITPNALKQTKTEVVFVMDHSGSMAERKCLKYEGFIIQRCVSYESPRLEIAKDAARDLVNELLPASTSGNVSVGFVSFGTDYESEYSTSELMSNKATVTAMINKLPVTDNNGTNAQAGLNAAKELFAKSEAKRKENNDTSNVNRIVIFLSDGEPTYYIGNNDKICGDGNSDDVDNSRNCNSMKPSTAAEQVAKELKSSTYNAEIYAIGFGESAEDIAGFLKNQIATDSKHAYTATDTEGLKTAMGAIVGNIKNIIATDAVLVDKIPAGFTLTEEAIQSLKDTWGEENVTISYENDAEGNLVNTVIEIKMAEIDATQGTQKIEYEVEPDKDHYGVMFTNESATLTATATEDNLAYESTDGKIEINFPKPRVIIAPVVVNDDYTSVEMYDDEVTTIGTNNSILANDSKIKHEDHEEGMAIANIKNEIVITEQPVCGTVKVNEDGTFEYSANPKDGTPCSSYENLTFKYKVVTTGTINTIPVETKTVESNEATVTIKVNKKPTKYTVEYRDADTLEEISSSLTKDGFVHYSSEEENAANIKSYELVSEQTAKIAALSSDESENIITFYYKKLIPEITNKKVTKDSKQTTIDSLKTGIDYKIEYSADVKNYEGQPVVTIVDKLPYEIDEAKSNLDGGIYNKENKTITWTITLNNVDTYKTPENVKVSKNITVFYIYPSEDVIKDSNYLVTNKVDASIDIDGNKKEEVGKEIPVEIKGDVKVIYVDEAGKEISTAVELPSKKIGETYDASKQIKKINGYTLVSKEDERYPANEVGLYKEEKTVVTYVYTKNPSTLVGEPEIKKSVTSISDSKGTILDRIEHSDDLITYSVEYIATIKDINGKATITLVDTLPYAIDVKASKLNGGKYDAASKTITWVIERDVDSYVTNSETNETIVTADVTFTVKYINIDATAANLVNKIKGTIKTDDIESVKEGEPTPTDIDIKGNVTVHYVDETNKELASSTKVFANDSKVGTNYETEAKKIAGYELVKNPSNKNGQVIEGNIDVTYVYKRVGSSTTEKPILTKTGTTIIKNKEDKLTYTLYYEATITNFVGKFKAVLVDELPYTIDLANSDLAGGKYDAISKTITWESAEFEVTDATSTKTVKIEKTITVKYNNIDITAASLSNKAYGYIVDDVAGENEKTETELKTEIDVKGEVVVKYVEEGTNKYLGGYSDTQKVGKEITTKEGKIAGYTLVKRPTSETITITEDTQVVTYYYQKNPAVITNAKAAKTTEILGNLTTAKGVIPYTVHYEGYITEHIGEATITMIDYLPYAIDVKASNLNGGVYDAKTNTITWTEKVSGINTYENGSKFVTMTKDITVKFMNMASNETFTNKLVGYVLADDAIKGKETAEVSIQAAIKGNVYVTYVGYDEKGNSTILAEAALLDGYVGTEYATEAKEFNGYKLVSASNNTTGKYTEEPIYVTYVYNRVEAQIKKNEITKKSNTEAVTSKDGKFEYTITYSNEIAEYIGDATITIVDHLSHPIDELKSDIAGGKYNKEDLTITWVYTQENIDSYKNQNSKLDVEIKISLVYKDLSATDRTVTNSVTATLKTDTTDPKNTEDKTETELKVNGKVIVKYVDEKGNVIATEEILTDLVGSEYQTIEKEIAGYVLTKVDGETKGVYKEEDIVVTYTYGKEGIGDTKGDPIKPPHTMVDSELTNISLLISAILLTLIALKKRILN